MKYHEIQSNNRYCLFYIYPTINLGHARLNEFLENKGFQQLVQCATRESGSLIDHIYANEALRSLDITTEQCSAYYLDHDVITLNIPK